MVACDHSVADSWYANLTCRMFYTSLFLRITMSKWLFFDIKPRDCQFMEVVYLERKPDGYPGHDCVYQSLLLGSMIWVVLATLFHASCLLLTILPVVAHWSGLLKKQSALHVFRIPARSFYHVYRLSLPLCLCQRLSPVHLTSSDS